MRIQTHSGDGKLKGAPVLEIPQEEDRGFLIWVCDSGFLEQAMGPGDVVQC